MRKNFNKIVALSMSVLMVGSMIPAMNVKADNAAAVKTVNSDFINGDFEKGIDAWKVSGNAEVVEEGTGHVLKVTDSAMVQATAWVVKPSTEYVVTYDAKLESAGSVSFKKVEWNWNGAAEYNLIETATVENAAEYTTVGSWGKKTYKFTTTANTTMVQIQMNISGKAYVDNVTFTPAAGIEEHATSGAEAWKDDKGDKLAECEAEVPKEEKYHATADGIKKFDMNDGNTFTTDISKPNNTAEIKTENGNKYISYKLGNIDLYTNHSYDIVAGKEYVVSFKYRVNDANSHSIALRFQENDGWTMNNITDYITSNTDGWVTVNTTYTPTSAISKRIDLFIACYGSTTDLASFDIDDFYMAEMVNQKKVKTIYENNMEESGLSTTPHATDPDAVITYKNEEGNKFMNYSCTNTSQYSGYSFGVNLGETYKVSYKIRVNAVNGSSIALGLQENKAWSIANINGYKKEVTSGWETVEGSYTVPEGVTNLDLFVLNYGSQTELSNFDIDDIKIIKVTDEDVDPVITKGGYGKEIGVNGTDGIALMTDESAYTTLANVKKDSTYEYGFWYKVVDADKDSNFAPVVKFGEDSKALVEKVEKNNGWTYASGTFTATADTATLGFAYAGKGTVYVSGVTVEDYVDVHVHHGAVKEYSATCTEDSKRVYTCDDCNNVVYSEYTGDYKGVGEKAKGHSFKIKVKTVAATYTEKGYTVYKCEHCDATKNDDFTPVKVKPTTKPTTKPTVKPTTAKVTKPAKVKKVKLTAKKKSLKISWRKVSGAKKYEVQVALKKSFKGAKKYTVKGTSKTVKKLKAKKKYYVRVRAIKTSGKTTVKGSWSSVANKKTK